jgi:leader peptidase (prepilin peptidase)/N-methyltransferase
VLDLIDVLRASTPIFAAVCAVLGLVVGSFLNVVIFRLPLMLKARWRTDCQLLDAPEGTEAPKAPRYDLAYPPSTCPG